MDRLLQFQDVTRVFLDELAVAPLAAKTTRTAFTVSDLGAHLGGVHRWVTANLLAAERTTRDDIPQGIGDVVEWYSTSRGQLLELFSTVEPTTPCWTMSKTDRTVAFWYRRQLHESLVHLWDLRTATDAAAPAPADVDSATWADGLREMFDVFSQRYPDRKTLDGVLLLQPTDTEFETGFTVGPDWKLDAAGDPVATVAGAAGELALWAWNRKSIEEAGLVVEGDAGVVAAFSAGPLHP